MASLSTPLSPSSTSPSDGSMQQWIVKTPNDPSSVVIEGSSATGLVLSYDELLTRVVDVVLTRNKKKWATATNNNTDSGATLSPEKKQRVIRHAYLTRQGKVVDGTTLATAVVAPAAASASFPCFLTLHYRLLGGIDRQNRVGSKFGGGGVSSSQQSERERKERLRKLALESVDLAKDPYLVRNHLGSYECKLCLTLHRDEANYLSHTQGKKHQQNLARRAHLDKLKQEKEGAAGGASPSLDAASKQQDAMLRAAKRVKIGRPAYHVFKSRDPETSQRCLSFELQYPEIAQDIQPRHRFMSAFEQKVESPPDRRYQYLLVAAEPYETVAFKIPNEPIDKGEDRFVTYWDLESKKFTLTLYFEESANKTAP